MTPRAITLLAVVIGLAALASASTGDTAADDTAAQVAGEVEPSEGAVDTAPPDAQPIDVVHVGPAEARQGRVAFAGARFDTFRGATPSEADAIEGAGAGPP